uniref:Uncharacterized protein n=1 Tax=Panagrolaimus davidi TaxID=227884 RepID=A0A914P9I9_9BILA
MFEEKTSPIIPPIFYDMLDPKYREKLFELENSFQFAALNSRGCQDLIVKFYNQFMMPQEFWNKLFDLKDLCLPDKALDVKLDNYEKYASSFIPKSVIRTHEKMKTLYSRIKSNEKNVDKWFEALSEVEDEEFVENNIEYRIGSDLTNKKLWKLYIEYLKEKDDKQKLLQTYSKYCRFFLDDSEMLKEYRETVGNQKISVPWKNPFDFEIFDETYFDNIEDTETEDEDEITEKSPLMFHFNAENASVQRFPFKPNLMNYILKNANAYILHNLFKTCKWFYLKNPVTICYKFDINQHFNNIEINEQRIGLNPSVLNQTNINKLYISTCFDVFYLLNENELSRFIPKIYRCSAKYISIREQKLSNKELTILLGHGNVEEFSFFQIKDSSDNFLIVENVLKMLPKIKRFDLDGVLCTSETSQKLCEFPFQNKLEWFSLTDINLLEPKVFAEFIGVC